MPAESYTPDPVLVDLVARAAYEADSTQILGDEQLTWDEQPEQCHDWFRAIARAVLAALATEGRLLPAGAEVRTEWGTRISSTDGWSEDFKCGTREFAQARIDYHAKKRAEDTRWKGRAELISRTRAVGPWLPAPTTDTEENRS